MDCIEGMKLMANGSVDAVIADLPYGVLNRSNTVSYTHLAAIVCSLAVIAVRFSIWMHNTMSKSSST